MDRGSPGGVQLTSYRLPAQLLLSRDAMRRGEARRERFFHFNEAKSEFTFL
jgi:hypothetical protein